MSAVLRVYGKDFDVDAFLVGNTLPVCAVKRRGEPVFAASQPNGRRHERSGVHVTVSDADFDELPRQTAEAAELLEAEQVQIRRLCEWPGVDDVSLDFGIERRDVVEQRDLLPAKLVCAAASFGLDIIVTQYPPTEADSDDEFPTLD